MIEYDCEKRLLTGRKTEFYVKNKPPDVISIAPCYQCFCFLDSSALVWIEESWHVLQPPCILFIPPMTSYAVCGNGKSILFDYFFIFISVLQKLDSCMPGEMHFYDSFLAYSTVGKCIFSLTEQQAEMMRTDFSEHWPKVSDLTAKPDTGYSAWVVGKIVWYLSRLCDCFGPPPAVSKKEIRFQVIEWVMKNLSRPFTLNEMAKALYLSPQRIQSRFKKETGLSVMKFVLRLKLSCASHYLLTTTPEKTAKKTGFANFSYFCQAFRAEFGKTPKQFREYELDLRKVRPIT